MKYWKKKTQPINEPMKYALSFQKVKKNGQETYKKLTDCLIHEGNANYINIMILSHPSQNG